MRGELRAGSDDLRVLDLRTGVERSLGRGALSQWVDDATLFVFTQPGGEFFVDVATGAREPASTRPGSDMVAPVGEGAGYRLEALRQHPPPTWLAWRTRYRVTRPATGATFEFDAYRATLTSDGTIVLATVPEPSTRVNSGRGSNDFSHATSNVFAVDPATRRATFVATAEPSYPNWPFAASAEHVVWNDRGCTPAEATTRLYERGTGRLVEVRDASGRAMRWPAAFTPGGAIAVGEFGAKALIDPRTLSYRVVLPVQSDVSWSRDYRYAVVAPTGGHGGLCGI